MNTYIAVLNKRLNILSTSKKSKNLLNLLTEIKKLPDIKRTGKIISKSKEYQYEKKEFKDYIILSFVDLTTVKRLSKLAWIDQLTGVFNRHAYWKMLQPLISDCLRSGFDLGIIFIDIDNLKEINKKQGYIGGDRAIAGIAKIVLKSIRKTDYVFRLGGDEFLILAKFKNQTSEAFLKLVEKVDANIKEKSKIYSTVSIGGKLIINKELKVLEKTKNFKTDWIAVVDSVDHLVKKAKKSGKNRFKINS